MADSRTGPGRGARRYRTRPRWRHRRDPRRQLVPRGRERHRSDHVRGRAGAPARRGDRCVVRPGATRKPRGSECRAAGLIVVLTAAQNSVAAHTGEVRATHDFVSPDDIQSFIPLVKDYLASSEPEFWVVSSDDGAVMGFMGLSGSKMEALFLAPEFRGHGAGRQLVQHARTLRGELTTDVNEQNYAARRFYELHLQHHQPSRRRRPGMRVVRKGSPVPVVSRIRAGQLACEGTGGDEAAERRRVERGVGVARVRSLEQSRARERTTLGERNVTESRRTRST